MNTLFKTDVRDHIEHWIMIFGTGTQLKGLHLPVPESTREDPETRCGYENRIDGGEPTAKDVCVFPRGYATDRICTPCARDLADELGRELWGDQCAH